VVELHRSAPEHHRVSSGFEQRAGSPAGTAS
jgi:hypothetical protein